jgi:putative transcriptional regulator
LIYTLLKYKDVFGGDRMDISEKIKELRMKTGLSQSKFSAKFGIPVRTLQQWEQGISAPPEYLVRMMAYIMLLEENGQIKDDVPIGEYAKITARKDPEKQKKKETER